MQGGETYDLSIIGGGILGTAVAQLASAAGWRVFCVRMGDEDRPRADTLRNQGWLQSGLLYPRLEFDSADDFEALGSRTFFAGRQLQKACGLESGMAGGIVATSDPKRAEELRFKADLLRMSPTEFRELACDEARSLLGGYFGADTSYFRIPDTPFDGAAVLDHMRRSAECNGTRFWVSPVPVTVEPSGSCTRIRFDRFEVLSPITLVASGSGSVALLEQLGHRLDCVVRRTPLLVSKAECFLPAPIYVDLDRGFSAVRHRCNQDEVATVVGTRARTQPISPTRPDDRLVSESEKEAMERCLHPLLQSGLRPWRVTVGEELIPQGGKLTQYEPWIEEYENVVFASPGRATVGQLAAVEVMARLNRLRNARQPAWKASKPASQWELTPWDGPIRMHFRQPYSFDDLENQ